jgi:hypothetical protein
LLKQLSDVCPLQEFFPRPGSGDLPGRSARQRVGWNEVNETVKPEVLADQRLQPADQIRSFSLVAFPALHDHHGHF